MALALAAFLPSQLNIVTGIDRLVPETLDPEIGQILRSLAESERTRVLVLAVRSADDDASRRVARSLADELRVDSRVAWAESGPPQGVESALESLITPSALLHLSPNPEVELEAWFRGDGPARAAADLKRAISGPLGTLVQKTATADPLLGQLRTVERLASLRPGGLRVEDGVYIDRHRRFAFVFVSTKASAFDDATQGPLLRDIEARFRRLADAERRPMRLLQAGIHRFAVEGRETAEADVSRVSVVSAILVSILFLVVFPSVQALLLVSSVLGVAVAAGAFAVMAVFGSIHVTTLGFGSTLLGVCIDYPIHWLNHVVLASGKSRLEDRQRTWRAIRLGAVTTSIGFVSLAMTGLHGLREIAIFGVSGVAAATLMTWISASALAGTIALPTHAHLALARVVDHWTVPTRSRRRFALAFLALLTFVAVIGVPLVVYQDDVLALSMATPTKLRQELLVRRVLGGGDIGRVIVAVGKDDEEALQRNDAVALRLEELRSSGAHVQYQSAHALLWSGDLQRRNWEALIRNRDRLPDLLTAFEDAGFEVGAFGPFERALGAGSPPVVRPGDLDGSPLARLAAPFRLDLPGGAAQLTFLSGTGDTTAVRSAVADLEGVHYVDQRAIVNEAFGQYRTAAVGRLGWAVVGVILLVAVQLRRARDTALACVPAVVAIASSAGVLALADVSLNLLHLASFVLVLSMVVDYGIFIAVERTNREAAARAHVGIMLAAAPTVVVFAVLATSVLPALRMVGQATAVGVLFGFAATVALFIVLGGMPDDAPD